VRTKIYVMLIFLLALNSILPATSSFKRVDQWKHDIDPLGFINRSIIDADGDVVISAFGPCRYVLSPKRSEPYGKFGQGPSDLTTLWAIFPYQDNMAFVEQSDKVKIFSKKDGTYVWKETVWLKRSRYFQMIRYGIFSHHKWFLAGVEDLDYGSKVFKVAHMRILDEKGNFIKHLVKINYPDYKRCEDFKYFLLPHRERIFYMMENRLEVKVISPVELTVVEEIPLKAPDFYKKMPDDFFLNKKEHHNFQKLARDLEYWKTSYSAITRAAVEGSHLVVQLRTCTDKLKKFALLFYDIDHNFKLARTVFIDDLFLGSKDGKYYFFANGNPGWDEDTDDCIINIYRFEEKDEKK
jgi:hypothetical protein